MLRACARLALFPFAWALHLIGPDHYPARPGIAIDHVPGPDRFEIDEGLPTPYHDRAGRSRQLLADAVGWWCERFQPEIAIVAALTSWVIVEWVVIPGAAGNWWPILRDFASEIVKGGYR